MFSEKQFSENDRRGKEAFRKLWVYSPYSRYQLVDPIDPFTCDFDVMDGDRWVASIEIEVKNCWKTVTFPWIDVQILPRKQKFWENERHNGGHPVTFVMFSSDLSHHLAFCDSSMMMAFNMPARSHGSIASRGEDFHAVPISFAQLDHFGVCR